MKKAQILVVAVILIAVLVVACGPKAAPAPAATGGGWQGELNRVAQAAKDEGKVVIYFAAGAGVRTAVVESFNKAYPGIDVEVISDRGSALAVKINTERSRGLYIPDIYQNADSPPVNILIPKGALAPLEPTFILPELTDPAQIKKTWYQGQLFWVDKKTRTTLGMALGPDVGTAINTNLLKPEEMKSWNVLLDPKWKGKVVINDPTVPGAGESFAIFTEMVMGPDFLAKLVANDPILQRDPRLQVEWLAHGKVAIVVAPNEDTLTDFIKAGAPVAPAIPGEGVWMATGLNCISWVDKAPHPNAAKLFVNWVLSKEGNTVFVRAAGQQSTRLDVPTDHVLPGALRKEGVKYWIKSNEEVIKLLPDKYKEWEKTLAPILKK